MPSVQRPGRMKINGTASAAAAAAAITSASADSPNASANVATIAAPRSTNSFAATGPTFVPATCSARDTGRIKTPSHATMPHTHAWEADYYEAVHQSISLYVSESGEPEFGD